MNLTFSLWVTLLGRLATEAVLLVALATVAQRFFTSPRAKGTLWQAVLLGLALVWLAELGGVRGQVARWWPQPRAARHLVVTLPGEPVSNLTIVDGFDAAAGTAFPEVVAKPSRPVWWPLQLWLAGFTALLFRATALRFWLGFTAGRLQRVTDAGLLERVENLRRRVGLRRVRVLAWPGLRSPIAFGTLRPTIALPADFAERFSSGAQEAMLAHELAHLAAGDPFWLALADAVLAFAWWHPAVWWARRQLRVASEATADEASALVPGGRVALAESLVTFGRELAAPGWTRGLGVAGDGLKSQLARRVTALLRPAGEWRVVRPGRLWLARGATLITATGLVALPWPGAGGPALAEVLLAVAPSWSTAPASGRPAEDALRMTSPDASATNIFDPLGRLKYEQQLIPGFAVINLKPEGTEVQQRYQLALQAAAEADRETARSRAEHGSGGVEFVRATEQSRKAWEQVALLKEATKTEDLDRIEKAIPLLNLPRAREASLPVTTNAAGLPTRQFKFSKEQLVLFNEHICQFLPPGGINSVRVGEDSVVAATQFGVHAFCATNGVNIPGGLSVLLSTLQTNDKAVFFNDRMGVLFVRATVDEIDRVERAIQALNLSPVTETQAGGAGRNAPSETTNEASLFSRQFKLRGEQISAFGERVRRFLPAGDTNLQAAVRAFCTTNGVTMPFYEGTPPQDRNAVFFNDRSGVLFVRATLDDLDRVDKAIQALNLPPAPAALATPYKPEPEVKLMVQARYELAMQAEKEADEAADLIYIKYGKDGTEGRQAADRYECAREKVSLLKSAIEMNEKLETLRAQYGEQDSKIVEALASRNGLLTSVESLSSSETNAVPVLFTRQFRLRGDQGVGFSEQVRRFMPAGETNLQVALRAFCATNGVSIRSPEGDFSPMAMVDRSAVFFNEAKGVLFVRASLGDLRRIERAIQTVSLSPAEADEIRSGQAKQLQASEARVAELRTHYEDNHPKVVEELEMQAHIRSSQRDFELNGRTAVTNVAPVGAAVNANRQIVLEVFFAEVTEHGPDDLGLDWLFGKTPTNNPALLSGPATNLLTDPGSPHGPGLHVDLLRTDGESSTLTVGQFVALRSQLDGRSEVDFLAAPKVVTLSGREAQVSVSEEKTIVSGLQETMATATNQAGINYQTEKVALGPKVDLIPVFEGENVRLGITATVTEFLGYDQPAVPLRGKPGKGVTGVTPLPRLRVRALHADSVSRPGDVVVLRGPLVTDTRQFKDKVPVLGDIPLLGRLFRSESKSTVRKRLYVFVTPTEVTATGERVVPVKGVPAP